MKKQKTDYFDNLADEAGIVGGQGRTGGDNLKNALIVLLCAVAGILIICLFLITGVTK